MIPPSSLTWLIPATVTYRSHAILMDLGFKSLIPLLTFYYQSACRDIPPSSHIGLQSRYHPIWHFDLAHSSVLGSRDTSRPPVTDDGASSHPTRGSHRQQQLTGSPRYRRTLHLKSLFLHPAAIVPFLSSLSLSRSEEAPQFGITFSESDHISSLVLTLSIAQSFIPPFSAPPLCLSLLHRFVHLLGGPFLCPGFSSPFSSP